MAMECMRDTWGRGAETKHVTRAYSGSKAKASWVHHQSKVGMLNKRKIWRLMAEPGPEKGIGAPNHVAVL